MLHRWRAAKRQRERRRQAEKRHQHAEAERARRQRQRAAVFLYLFLAAVSNRQGLSFHRDTTLAVRLRMREQAVVAAREELVTHDLIAFQSPLTQVQLNKALSAKRKPPRRRLRVGKSTP